MLPGGSVMAGVALRGVRAGERTEVATGGADEAPGDLNFLMHHAGMLLDEASKVGVHTPERFIFRGAQVFYRRGRPSEARVAGVVLSADGQAIIPWSTDPAPQWAEDGGMLPIDASRTHQSARVSQTESGPVLGRWWNLDEHVRSSFVPWRDFADLAESEADFPEALQGVARFVLGKLKEDGDAAAGYALSESGAPWRDKLVRRVKLRLVELRHAAGMDGETRPEEDSGADTTSKAAAWMAETFENGGKVSAEDLLEQAKSYPWAPWLPGAGFDFAFVLRRLTRLVWQNEVEADAGRACAQRPGLVRGIYVEEVLAVQTSQTWLPGMEARELRDRHGRIVATIDASKAELTAVHNGLAILRSPLGNRLLKNLVLTAHRQAEAGEALFNRVQFDGGYQGMAKALSYAKRDFGELVALAKMGQHVNWQSRNDIHRGGGWWLVHDKRGGPGAPGFVRFTLADCFLPGFAAGLAQDGGSSLSARLARRLLPELPCEPPMGGLNERSHGAVWVLHRLFLLELVDRAEELAKDGFVVIPMKRFQELAQTAGLPANLLERVLKAWTEGESETAPKMVERNGDGWRLALATYQPEHDFIVDAGQRRASGRSGGRTKADKRKGGR